MLKPVVPGDEKGREGTGWTYWGHRCRGGGTLAGSPRGVRVLLGWWRLAG